MTPERYQSVRELYQAACQLSGGARNELVARLCNDDAELLSEVQSLLRHHDDRPDALAEANLGIGRELLAGHGSAAVAGAAAPTDPQQIGPYRILRRLGAGGMGTVYEAEQIDPVRRRVALKVIKLGMDTHEVVARFDQERQAVALMDHPHIARVLDAGATDTGRPYFVMELCTGEPITDFCDAQRLSIAARLTLSVQVCRAVQHAHQKALIHRDIKPSNILVSLNDGQPHAKVIDFGIAKATTGGLTAHQTQNQQLIGTPEYMSPEQAEGSRDIDTRTDVYSLGVLLYELLTGCTPFRGEDLRAASLSEIQRIIREVDPLRPSTRLRQTAQSIATVAAARSAAPQKLLPLLRGELDCIVMKAIEKDRAQRYESAGAFAADIERFLAGEIVHAAPPNTAYRVRKFVQRNRALVVGSAVVTAALLVGLAGTLWQAGVAGREAKAARAAESVATRIATFQSQMLEQIDASSAGEQLFSDIRSQYAADLARSNLSAEDRDAQRAQFDEHLKRLNATDIAANMLDATILTPAASSMPDQLADQPLVEASLNQTLATLYRSLGRYSAARRLQEKALATRTQILGEDHPDTLVSMQALGYLLRLQGEIPAAEFLLSDALARCRRVLGPDHATTLQTQSVCGGILRLHGRYAEAEACWSDVLERRRRVLGETARETLASINNLGFVLEDQGKLAEAERAYRDAFEKRRRVLGPDHPDTLISLNFVGHLLSRQNRFNEAEACWREALEKRRRILGDSHPQTVNSIANMGELLLRQGRVIEAEPLLREAMEKRRDLLGENHSLARESTRYFRELLISQDRLNEAQTLEPDLPNR